MGLFSRFGSLTAVLGVALWLFYSGLQVSHLYDTAIRVPPTQRVARDIAELRLPRIYFCPADRGRMNGIRWQAFECKLSYKEEQRTCPGRLLAYYGREPEEFKNNVTADGSPQAPGGVCLEFGTHYVGVREEWSSAWNEVTLRGSFLLPPATADDALQEVELGYAPEEWEIGNRKATVSKYYYPLLRVPFFFLQSLPGPSPSLGVATRAFLGREVDRGLTTAGKYWFTYGAMRIDVQNATQPMQSFREQPWQPQQRLGVVHVVLTLEDFEEFDFQVVSCFFPLLATLGQIAGVGALMAFFVARPSRRSSAPRSAREEAEPPEAESCEGPGGGPQYTRVAAPEEDEGSGEEAQALLGSAAARDRERGRAEDRLASQALLGTEEGLDGL